MCEVIAVATLDGHNAQKDRSIVSSLVSGAVALLILGGYTEQKAEAVKVNAGFMRKIVLFILLVCAFSFVAFPADACRRTNRSGCSEVGHG